MRSHPADGTRDYDPALDAWLADAFGPESTAPRGWSRPPLLREDPSDFAPLVRPDSPDMPRGTGARYELHGEIARGGMGVVLKGRDPDLGRDLAVKVLKAEFAHRPVAEQRFVEEAQVGGQLQHPGVVPVYELGRFADGRPYFTMKLVKGRTLAAFLTERPDPSHERGRWLKVFDQVCQAIAYAHSRGVIHRDLKPANVMVGAFGEVQVMDWGLSKVLPQGGVADEERASRGRQPLDSRDEPTIIRTARSGSGAGSETQAGSVLGTPAFMPPEQAGGEIGKLDERADVFGLGAILCVILTGQAPYVADDGEAVRLMAVRGKLADAFARVDACGADAELVGLCKRCLAAEREDRPRHAGEVAAAVAAYLSEIERRAHRAEVERAKSETRAAEERKRRQAQLALAVSLGLLLLGGGAVGWWQDRQAADRQAQLTRNADALADLLARCEAALRADDVDRAATALGEIDRRLAEGGGESVQDRAARCRADLAVLRELDAADQFRWTPVERRLPDDQEVAGQYRAALGGFRADPGAVGAEEAARRVAGSAVRDRLVAALDWVLLGEPSAAVRAGLRAADPNPFRDGVRDALATGDVEAVARWVGRPAAADQPARFVTVLAEVGGIQAEQRLELLASVARRRPGELGLLMALGNLYPLNKRAGAGERVRWFQAAVAAAPTSVSAHSNLGIALHDHGDLVGAVGVHREAVRLDPTSALAHHNLAAALGARRDAAGAVAASREAVRLAPASATTLTGLGFALRVAGDVAGAVGVLREAIRLDPRYTPAHYNLGKALAAQRDMAGAIRAYREAIRLDPTYAHSHHDLGVALQGMGDLTGAVGAYREAVRFDPKDAQANFDLGVALALAGRPAEALRATTDALRANPAWADDRGYPFRYNAACFALNCADGKGADAPPTPGRPAYRGQALAYLTADLAATRRRLAADPVRNRDSVHQWMWHWLQDTDLASVRDRSAWATQPAGERAGWEGLWAEVRDLCDATAPREKAPPPRPAR